MHLITASFYRDSSLQNKMPDNRIPFMPPPNKITQFLLKRASARSKALPSTIDLFIEKNILEKNYFKQNEKEFVPLVQDCVFDTSAFAFQASRASGRTV